METLKKVIPFVGSKQDESGQEPVSGVVGQGTSTEPYDAGNKEGKHYLPFLPWNHLISDFVKRWVVNLGKNRLVDRSTP